MSAAWQGALGSVARPPAAADLLASAHLAHRHPGCAPLRPTASSPPYAHPRTHIPVRNVPAHRPCAAFPPRHGVQHSRREPSVLLPARPTLCSVTAYSSPVTPTAMR